MGLECLAAVLQGKHDNYDTDLLRAILEASAEASNQAPDGEHAVSHRVIADHLRASAFLIADASTPSHARPAHRLRRIIPRGLRHAPHPGLPRPPVSAPVP